VHGEDDTYAGFVSGRCLFRSAERRPRRGSFVGGAGRDVEGRESLNFNGCVLHSTLFVI
jgi:hypothetical protein